MIVVVIAAAKIETVVEEKVWAGKIPAMGSATMVVVMVVKPVMGIRAGMWIPVGVWVASPPLAATTGTEDRGIEEVESINAGRTTVVSELNHQGTHIPNHTARLIIIH